MNRSCQPPATCKVPAGGHGKERPRNSLECGSASSVRMQRLTCLVNGGKEASIQDWPNLAGCNDKFHRTSSFPLQVSQWVPNLMSPGATVLSPGNLAAAQGSGAPSLIRTHGAPSRSRASLRCPDTSKRVMSLQSNGSIPCHVRRVRIPTRRVTKRKRQRCTGHETPHSSPL